MLVILNGVWACLCAGVVTMGEELIGGPGLLLVGDKLVSSDDNESLVFIEAVELKELVENTLQDVDGRWLTRSSSALGSGFSSCWVSTHPPNLVNQAGEPV